MAEIAANQNHTRRQTVPPFVMAPAASRGEALRLLALHTRNTVIGRLLAHKILISVCAALLTVALALGLAVDRMLPLIKGFEFGLALTSCATVAVAGILAYRFAVAFFFDKDRGALDIARGMLLSPRWTNAVPAFLSLAILVAAMNAVVASLPALDGSSGNPALIALDRALHLGALPHQITHAVASHAVLTVFLDKVFQTSLIWVLVFYAAIACARQDTPNRQQFLISLSLAWAAGAAIMVLMSTAGPGLSLQMAAGQGPYGDLYGRLAAVDANHSLWTFDMLRARLEAGTGTHFAAITALPSLVTASLTVVALAALGVDRRIGLLACAIALMSSIAAVHLGWNHAIDCYAGAILGFIAWKSAGWLVRRMA